ncbi:glycoside hydrolase family 3 N-terminal domain-containing protein [Mesorhizobium sp. 113-3-3]|uniref:glycoside hydrolase family 3 N-terminal domain-containing protein n=1 Tax=Mesorhizobium sp. 113-3-3 TaxID=2744516 RepID=UPI001FD4C5CF|nr:glycoside hydrolase family 3 N-terminal domain-containing protein [Mesorhizobium sp. 113-3-3]
MNDTLLRDAHAVFLPAFDNWDFGKVMHPFIANGGCSILIGESRHEYVQRKMSAARLRSESTSQFKNHIDALRAQAGKLIVAVDQELGGIRRLEGLASDFPSLSLAQALSDPELEARCFESARSAQELGVSMFLAPIVDTVDGENAWLNGRTMSSDVNTTARMGAAFVRGVQRAGITAITKHFPGFNHMDADPALTDVALATELDRIISNAATFKAAIAAGTKGVMVGPAPVIALDSENAACVSKPVVDLLRNTFQFKGLIVSDDLDAPATMRGNSLLDTAIKSLNAGVDLLLVAGGEHLQDLCLGVLKATQNGILSPDRLHDAAQRVRAHATT